MFWKSKKSKRLCKLQERLEYSERKLHYLKSIDEEKYVSECLLTDTGDYCQTNYEISVICNKMDALDKLQPVKDSIKEEITRRKAALDTDKYLLELRIEEIYKRYREEYHINIEYFEKKVSDLLHKIESL